MLNRLLAGVLIAASGTPAAVITVLPSSQTVLLGSGASVDLNISGLGSGVAPSLSVFDIDLAFDASILSFSSVVFGSDLDVLGFGSVQGFVPGIGTVNLFEVSLDGPADLDALQPDAFTLATLTFNTLSGGTSPLTLSVNTLGDAIGDPLPATLVSGSVEVSAVPEPSTWLLMSGGLTLLACGVRRRRPARGRGELCDGRFGLRS